MKKFEINRIFTASQEEIFAAWTETDILKKWWGPVGFQLSILKFDFHPEGIFHYNMKTADGYEMWGRFRYTEIKKPTRLCFVNSFSDADGNITQAPFSADWPGEISNELSISELDGKTEIKLHGSPVNASELQQQTFEANFESMTIGFNDTFDRLQEYLENPKSTIK